MHDYPVCVKHVHVIRELLPWVVAIVRAPVHTVRSRYLVGWPQGINTTVAHASEVSTCAIHNEYVYYCTRALV